MDGSHDTVEKGGKTDQASAILQTKEIFEEKKTGTEQS